MFWLNPTTSVVTKTAAAEAEETGSLFKAKDPVAVGTTSFPICTAFSPSAKAIKIPTKYYNNHQTLVGIICF